jgi:ornithine cyclodeaminase/alanine dehydrogenase-like protein (mu-crystallin family)
MTTRRTFLKASAAAVAVPAVAPAVGQPDTLTVALIGCGGMGKNHLNLLARHKQLKIAYVCDVDADRLKEAAKIATDGGHKVTPVKDLRTVLDNRAVNAIWIATPDHWHAPGASSPPRPASTSTSRSRAATTSARGG